MSAFEIPVRAFRGLLACALLSAAACGGNVFQSNGGAGSGGGFSATAGAGSGETGGSAGWVGGAGAPAAGAYPGGASSGGQSNIAGAGGTSSGGRGSAGGSSAGAGGTDMQACLSNADCEVVPLGCCSCGTGPVSSYTAINSMFASQYESHCDAVDCACPPIAFNPNNPVDYYVALCQPSTGPDLPNSGVAIGGHCVVVDLEATDITACKTASDCSLRGGTGCCSACGGTPIAINSSKELELSSEVCGDVPQACAACAPLFSGFDATCNAGRCNVGFEPVPTPVPAPCTPQNPCPD
jgi:hypothetical protein